MLTIRLLCMCFHSTLHAWILCSNLTRMMTELFRFWLSNIFRVFVVHQTISIKLERCPVKIYFHATCSKSFHAQRERFFFWLLWCLKPYLDGNFVFVFMEKRSLRCKFKNAKLWILFFSSIRKEGDERFVVADVNELSHCRWLKRRQTFRFRSTATAAPIWEQNKLCRQRNIREMKDVR